MILLQILDEGTVTDSQGRKVDFKVCPNYGGFPSCSAIHPCRILSSVSRATLVSFFLFRLVSELSFTYLS